MLGFRAVLVIMCAASALAQEPITFGQVTEAPLPGIGRSRDFIDWDGDGLLDLVMLIHPRYTGVDVNASWSKLVLLRNIGKRNNPLFPPVDESQTILHDERLGFHFAFLDHDGDGRRDVVSVKGGVPRIFIAGRSKDKTEWQVLEAAPLELDAHENSPTIGVVDWDDDGREDLLLGVNQPKLMKRGFGVRPEFHQPLAGRIYFVRNTSAGDAFSLAEPEVLRADGEEIRCFGFVYPDAFDMDGDHLPDLISGEHRPGIRVYRNAGKAGAPQLTYSGAIEDADGKTVSTALAFQVRSADLDNDGRRELITASYYGSPSFMMRFRQRSRAKLHRGWVSEGFLPMRTAETTGLAGPGISTPEPVDWDGDGDTDLLLGAEPGTPMVALNIGSGAARVFAPPRRLRFVDGSLLETYSSRIGDGSHHGAKEWFDDRSTPRAVDWDRDGTLDIVSGTQGRRLYWMRGKNVDGELRFERPQVFRLGGRALLHPHRCLPAVVDWDGDGFLDIVGFDERSDLVVYPGAGNSELRRDARSLKDESGQPISASTKINDPPIDNTRSGRSGVAAVDWDADGELDLITFKHYFDGGVLFYRGLGEDRFAAPVRLFDFFSHLAGPGVTDWNGDGYPDLLMGGDYRRLCGLFHQMPGEDRAHYFVYDGRSLPAPSAKR